MLFGQKSLRQQPSTVDSPCINVCALDETGVFCTGCLRTRAEIGRWSLASDDEKRAILALVEARKHIPT